MPKNESQVKIRLTKLEINVIVGTVRKSPDTDRPVTPYTGFHLNC